MAKKQSKAEHILYGMLFVVEMFRWGNLEEHHYTAGVFDNEYDAKTCGVAEYYYRAGKYSPTIYKHKINNWRNGTKQQMFEEIEDSSFPHTEKLEIDKIYEQIRVEK